jgi:hypothetical protein
MLPFTSSSIGDLDQHHATVRTRSRSLPIFHVEHKREAFPELLPIFQQ